MQLQVETCEQCMRVRTFTPPKGTWTTWCWLDISYLERSYEVIEIDSVEKCTKCIREEVLIAASQVDPVTTKLPGW